MTATAWRVIWEEGVSIEGTWVPLALLQRLDRVHPYLGPSRANGQYLDRGLGELLAQHELARAASRTGYRAGKQLRVFLRALDRTPQPDHPGGAHEPA